MTETIYNHINAVIGIIGTLSGVILGAILNQIFRSGKLKIFPNNFQLVITKRTKNGDFESQDAIDPDTSNVSIEFNLDLYNSSSDQKIGREINLVLKKDGKEIKEVVKDLSTTSYTKYSSHTERLENFNIPPKTLANFKLRTYISKEKYNSLNYGTIFFEFKDHKNRTQRIKLAVLNQIIKQES